MAAARQRIADRAGHGKYLATLLTRQASGDQRTGTYAGLDHQDAGAHPADDPVAGGEMAGPGTDAGGEAADHRAIIHDSASQITVPCRVNLVRARAAYGQRDTAGI